MNYLRVPREVNLSDIHGCDTAWSPSNFCRVIIPNSNVKPVKHLLVDSKPFDRGVEPGSMHYLTRIIHEGPESASRTV